MPTIHCPLPTLYCPLPTAHCLVLTLLPIAHYPLPNVHSPVYADSDQSKDRGRAARHVHCKVEVAHEAGESPRPVDLQQNFFYCSEL
jgi:hypothetical protein